MSVSGSISPVAAARAKTIPGCLAPAPGEQVGTTGLVACPDILDDLIPGVLHFLPLMGEMFFKHNAGVI